MHATIQQWGNSLALRIPKALARQTRIRKGSPVSLTLENGRFVMKPLARRKYRLKELVSKITPANRHSETDWGPARGKEIW